MLSFKVGAEVLHFEGGNRNFKDEQVLCQMDKEVLSRVHMQWTGKKEQYDVFRENFSAV